MIENLIVTASNLYAAAPTWDYYIHNMDLPMVAIILSAIASMLYHLFEHQKHHMPGMGIFGDPCSHIILINIDRFCAVGAIIVCAVTAKWKNVDIYVFCLVAGIGLISVFISEFVSKFFPDKVEKWVHVFFHSVWHILAFECARELAVTHNIK